MDCDVRSHPLCVLDAGAQRKLSFRAGHHKMTKRFVDCVEQVWSPEGPMTSGPPSLE